MNERAGEVRGSSTVSPNQHGRNMKIDSGVVSAQSNHEQKPSTNFIQKLQTPFETEKQRNENHGILASHLAAHFDV